MNRDKCEFKSEIEFFGHVISKSGVQPIAERIKALVELPSPTNFTEICSVIGMINYIGRLIPHLSTIMQPITSLLIKVGHCEALGLTAC